MKYLIIDDENGVLQKLCKTFNYGFQIVNEKTIENEIKDCINSVFLINAELSGGLNSQRIDFKGIEILKEIRIKHKLLCPILLCGFLELSNILENHPEHLIITAPGNKYLQFPFSKSTFENVSKGLKTFDTFKELKEVYRSFIKTDFDIRDIDHSFANEFGLELMIRAHNEISESKLQLEILNNEKLKGLIAKSDFLYSYSRNENLKPKIVSLRNKLIEFIKTQKKRILFIDDQGENAWYDFYKNLLVVNNNQLCFCNIDNSSFCETPFIKEIKEFMPDIVLLDLRLKGDQEKHSKIDKISGYQVLQTIKNKFPFLPVIITSATNKSDNLSALLKAKAFGLWSKPRIEQGDIDIYEKYYDLLFIINDALSFYKYNEEKVPIKADYLINNIGNVNSNVKEYLNNYDLIVTDTNCWMMGLNNQKTIDEVARLYKNIYITATTVSRDDFLIIDDVKRELQEHLHKIIETEDKETQNQLNKNAIMAAYGISLMHKIIFKQTIWIYDQHLTNLKIGNRFSFKYYDENNVIYEKCFEFNSSSRSYNEIYKREYRKIAEGYIENNLNNLNKRRKVFADLSFRNILFHKLTLDSTYNKYENKKTKILFISDDIECKDNLYYLINKKCILTDHKLEKWNKKGIEKVNNGTFKGSVDDTCFTITLIDPFEFSNNIEILL